MTMTRMSLMYSLMRSSGFGMLMPPKEMSGKLIPPPELPPDCPPELLPPEEEPLLSSVTPPEVIVSCFRMVSSSL